MLPIMWRVLKWDARFFARQMRVCLHLVLSTLMCVCVYRCKVKSFIGCKESFLSVWRFCCCWLMQLYHTVTPVILCPAPPTRVCVCVCVWDELCPSVSRFSCSERISSGPVTCAQIVHSLTFSWSIQCVCVCVCVCAVLEGVHNCNISSQRNSIKSK